MEANTGKKKDLAWKKAAVMVLNQAGKAMHYADIATEIQRQRLRLKVGATPASTVNVVIHDSIKKEGADSPFKKVGAGEFVLKGMAIAALPSHKITGKAAVEIAQEEEETETGGIIKAFGMFWKRDWVVWVIKPTLFGQQQEGADRVDFADQIGVYLLHDGREVVYVGRATEKRLAMRLSEHTRDRLNGRWDRFSWFGLQDVTDKGRLSGPNLGSLTSESIIVTLEALLIEGLEPRQNRRRGDAFRAVEYLQVEDPELLKQSKKKLAAEMLAKI